MTADIRAAVLAGIKFEETFCGDETLPWQRRLANALRLLREDTERHRQEWDAYTAEAKPWCASCGQDWTAVGCPTLLERAQVYAPDALKEKAKLEPVFVEIDPADIARVYEPGTCAHPESCPCSVHKEKPDAD